MADQFGDFTYIENATSITISGYPTSAVGPVVIPDTIVDKPVTAIGNYAFINCIGMTSLTIPQGLTSIGSNAFYQCKGLSSVDIPSSVTTIGQGAFYSCSGLTNVVIPSGVTTIANALFYSCSSLTSVTLPSTITSIGTFAFQYCSGLTTVTIPPNVTSLTNKVFANCRGLTSVEIPASVVSVHIAAFVECSSLTSITVAAGNSNYSSLNGLLTNSTQTRLITCPAGKSGNFTIPSSLTVIGNQAFRLCVALTGVTFHSGVTSIESQAFSACGKLINAVFEGDPPNMGGFSVFELTSPGFAVYYLKVGTGFTSPEWEYIPGFGVYYPAFHLDAITPEFTWLSANGLPGYSNFLSDTNGDGVNLLMAYALNLNPNLWNSLPQPVFGASQMSISFYAATPGITYVVRTSDDMLNWSAAGVPLTGPVTYRTATVGLSGPKRFMRLEVSH